MGTDPDTPTRRERRKLLLCSAAIALAALALLLATSPRLPMGWDEGNAIGRAQKISAWARSWAARAPGQPHPLSRRAIEEHWPYTTRVEGHPAFYGIVLAAGQWTSGKWLPPLEGWRFGPMLLFSLAAGAMFHAMARQFGRAAGLAAALALLVQPRLFAHAHFALADAMLAACWVLAWAAFTSPRPNWRRAVLFGLLLGMAMSTKAPGWFAPIPFILWAALYRDGRAAAMLALGLPIALAAFYLLNPPLWHEPLAGLATFVHLNTHRQVNVAILFLGRMYDLHHALPWYNTLVWTAITVPAGLLALAVLGVLGVVRRGRADRAGVLLILNWLILLVVRALPGTPPHDGIRLFLPSFAFLAALAGLGAAQLLGRLKGCPPLEPIAPGAIGRADGAQYVWPSLGGRHTEYLCIRYFRTAVVALVFIGSASNLAWYAPQWLSYYNLLIGGLRGAAAAGMEPTYYWDALDGEVLGWLEAHTAGDEKVRFGSGSPENLALMRAWGMLGVEYRPDAPGRYAWYVIQRRPSACMPPDRWLLENARPVYRKTLRQSGWGPWRLDVPLIEIYRYADFAAAREATRGR